MDQAMKRQSYPTDLTDGQWEEIALCATFAGTNRPKWNFSVNTASKKQYSQYG